MDKILTDFGGEKTRWEAVVFYFMYYGVLALLLDLYSLLALLLDLSMQQFGLLIRSIGLINVIFFPAGFFEATRQAAAARPISIIIGVLLSVSLSVLILYRKKLFDAFLWCATVVVLLGLLSVLSGGKVGLIPVAFLTICKSKA